MAVNNELDDELSVLARAAGLDAAIRQFPEDVAAAARAAEQARRNCGVPGDVAAEPWPPMRAKTPS